MSKKSPLSRRKPQLAAEDERRASSSARNKEERSVSRGRPPAEDASIQAEDEIAGFRLSEEIMSQLDANLPLWMAHETSVRCLCLSRRHSKMTADTL